MCQLSACLSSGVSTVTMSASPRSCHPHLWQWPDLSCVPSLPPPAQSCWQWTCAALCLCLGSSLKVWCQVLSLKSLHYILLCSCDIWVRLPPSMPATALEVNYGVNLLSCSHFQLRLEFDRQILHMTNLTHDSDGNTDAQHGTGWSISYLPKAKKCFESLKS